VGIAAGLIQEDAGTLTLLRQLFPRRGTHSLVRYGLVSAGVDPGVLTRAGGRGSAALAFNPQEAAFIQEVLERLAGLIAIQPELCSDGACPFQLASVAKVPGEDDTTGMTSSQFVTSGDPPRLLPDESYLLIELELQDDPGLSVWEQNAIVHELGHALGLRHPGGNPEDPRYTDRDTVMSYNVGADGPATWFSESDLGALQSIWGAPAFPLTRGPTTSSFRLDALISGGTVFSGFDPELGDRLEINAQLVRGGGHRLIRVDSTRDLKQAQRSPASLVFDESTSALHLNSNGRRPGWGGDGGLLAVFDPGLELRTSHIQWV